MTYVLCLGYDIDTLNNRSTLVTLKNKDVRLIKKYPNRRLYDTQNSCYITLDDARQMVVDNTSFKVVDRKTEQDLTSSILLQIIMEQENNGEPLFNEEMLSQFIRNYGDNDNFTSFLQASLQMFSEQQVTIVGRIDVSFHQSPMDLWAGMTQKNLDHFAQLHHNFYQSAQSDKSKK
jgi:polyhydroxyalkanoate synthesis repressor PhaR